ncbi:MAG TPA: monovalent cation/H+ antiporter complex subunit F [Rubrobacteraceae bacterium]|nr:monovalent cation/H+ antiporter complex subunit F [Rubrobacteraceae bacterium]
MHEIVFYPAVFWMTVLLVVGVVAVVGISSTTGRILALDTLTLVLVALLVLYGDAQREVYYLDVALILALLAFVGTVAAARYYGERKIF